MRGHLLIDAGTLRGGAQAAWSAPVLTCAPIGTQDIQQPRHQHRGSAISAALAALDVEPRPKLPPEQKQELTRIVEGGPDPATDGVVRWRCVDLRRVIKERFDVDPDEVSLGRVFKELGFDV